MGGGDEKKDDEDDEVEEDSPEVAQLKQQLGLQKVKGEITKNCLFPVTFYILPRASDPG